MRTTLLGCLTLLLAAGASCGGPKYQVHDAVLSDLPLQEKGGMLAAKGEMDRAAEEKNKARADVAIDDRDISVAEAEGAQAKMESAKLEADLRLAERGEDLNRIRAAKGSFTAVNSARHTSEAKLNWLSSRRDYDRALVEVADLHATAAERRYELEKARLAQATGKLPSANFNLGQFEGQAAQAQQRYDEGRARADRQRAKTTQLEQQYSQFATSRGRL